MREVQLDLGVRIILRFELFDRARVARSLTQAVLHFLTWHVSLLIVPLLLLVDAVVVAFVVDDIIVFVAAAMLTLFMEVIVALFLRAYCCYLVAVAVAVVRHFSR